MLCERVRASASFGRVVMKHFRRLERIFRRLQKTPHAGGGRVAIYAAQTHFDAHLMHDDYVSQRHPAAVV
eukprot:6213642-Pleurochrysis_carterae.AAC.1